MSKKNVPDAELAKEWPYLTRGQVKDFKAAFAIFDKDGGGAASSLSSQLPPPAKPDLRLPRDLEARYAGGRGDSPPPSQLLPPLLPPRPSTAPAGWGQGSSRQPRTP